MVLSTDQLLFEVVDVFGKKIRTSKQYWNKIKQEKHQELWYDTDEVIQTLDHPDKVFQSVTDSTIALYRKNIEKQMELVIVVKHLNGEGFVITAYQTSKPKYKGVLLWPK